MRRRDITVLRVVDQPHPFKRIDWSPINITYHYGLEDAIVYAQQFMYASRDPEITENYLIPIFTQTVNGFGVLVREEDGTSSWYVYEDKESLYKFLETVKE